MRGSRCAVAVAIGVLAAGGWVTGTTAPAAADSTAVPGTLSTVAQQTGPVAVAVPPGVTPTAVTGVLSMPAVVDGSSFTILVNGRSALTVASTLYTKVVVPLLPGDVVADGSLAVSLRYDAPPGADPCADPPAATLRKLGLDYQGSATPPTSPADFFPAVASRIDVQIPRDTSDDVVQAALVAVAALGHRYPADVPVVLSPADQPLASTGAGQRLVSFVNAGGDVTTSLDTSGPVPTLVLTGSGLPLTEAARMLGSTGPASTVAAATGDRLTRTLAQLRADSPGVTASAPGTQTVEIRQDSFGRAVSSYVVHLVGTHSAVPAAAEGRLDVYLGDRLVGSSVIGDDAAVDLDLTIPGSALHTTDVLRATVRSASDPSQLCSPALPLELVLDDQASTVTARPARTGTGPRGFAAFPQTLAGRLPIALRPTGPARLDAVLDAGALVSALQRGAARPLDVTIVDPDRFVDGDRSGLLLGASDDDTLALNAPLRLAGTGVPDSARTTFSLAPDVPYAALEAVAQDTRQVLLLGSWAPGDAAAPPGYSHRIVDRITALGWTTLTGDVVVADPDGTPTDVDSGLRYTPDRADDEGGSSYTTWFAVGIAVLLALIALQVLLALRRDRRLGRERRAEALDDADHPRDDEADGYDGDDGYEDDADLPPAPLAVEEPLVVPAARRRHRSRVWRRAPLPVDLPADLTDDDGDSVSSYEDLDDLDDADDLYDELDDDPVLVDGSATLTEGRQPRVHLSRGPRP